MRVVEIASPHIHVYIVHWFIKRSIVRKCNETFYVNGPYDNLCFFRHITACWFRCSKILHKSISLPCRITSVIVKFMGPTWAHLGPVVPRWVPQWRHEPCYQGRLYPRPQDQATYRSFTGISRPARGPRLGAVVQIIMISNAKYLIMYSIFLINRYWDIIYVLVFCMKKRWCLQSA